MIDRVERGVIVTGAVGFLGGHLARLLSQHGYHVLRIARARPADDSALPYLPWDLATSGAIRAGIAHFPESRRPVVAHFAAALPATASANDEAEAAILNRRIDDLLFSECVELGCPILYASAATAYSPLAERPQSEADALHPRGPYTAGKLESESLGLAMAGRSGVPFSSLRISAPYGSGQRARTVLQYFVERALRDLPLTYYGSGSREQDFIHATDVARAVLAVLQRDRHGIFNIASGHVVTMRRLAEIVVRAVPGCRSAIEAAGREDPQEGFRARVSIAKAERELGWTPTMSLADGVRHLADVVRATMV